MRLFHTLSSHLRSAPRLLRSGLGFVVWGVVLTMGFRSLIEFETTAGAPGVVRAAWPADAPVAFEAGKSNLVMFAHPKCPCSRASLAELVKVLTRTKGALQASILFYTPTDGTREWKGAEL